MCDTRLRIETEMGMTKSDAFAGLSEALGDLASSLDWTWRLLGDTGDVAKGQRGRGNFITVSDASSLLIGAAIRPMLEPGSRLVSTYRALVRMGCPSGELP